MLRSVELNTPRMSLHPTKVRDKGSAALARHTAAVITTAFGGVGLRFRLPLSGPKAGHFTHHEKHHTYSCVRDLRESETQLLTHVNAVSSRDGTKAAAEKVRHHKAQKSGGVPEGRFRLFDTQDLQLASEGPVKQRAIRHRIVLHPPWRCL